MHPSATIHPDQLVILELEGKIKPSKRSDSPPPPLPPLPTDLANLAPNPPMTQKLEYEFWQCGHITRINDGRIITENGEIGLLPKWLVDRETIKESFGDACPRCYTERILQRLQSIKLLLFDCNTGQEAVKMAIKRVTALTDYLSSESETELLEEGGSLKNYPPEFRTMLRHVVELGTDVLNSASEDFAAAQKRLRSRETQKFVDRINAVRDNAQLYFTTGNTPAVRECMSRIVAEAADMVKQVQEYEREELLLVAQLDAKAAALQDLLTEYLESERQRSEALRNPQF